MIASPERKQDLEIRANLLELMEMALTRGDIEGAKAYGETARKYGDRTNKPYPQHDEWMRPITS